MRVKLGRLGVRIRIDLDDADRQSPCPVRALALARTRATASVSSTPRARCPDRWGNPEGHQPAGREATLTCRVNARLGPTPTSN